MDAMWWLQYTLAFVLGWGGYIFAKEFLGSFFGSLYLVALLCAILMVSSPVEAKRVQFGNWYSQKE